MASDTKRQALIYLAVALVVTVVVSSSLPRLRLQPGLPPPDVGKGEIVLAPAIRTEPPVGMRVDLFFELVLLVAVAAFVGYLLRGVLKGIPWKLVLRKSLPFLLMLLAVIAILAFSAMRLPEPPARPAAPPAEVLPEPPALETAPLGSTPSLLVLLVAGALLCASAAGLWWLSRSRRTPPPASWQDEAERAREGLLAGKDFRDVILSCYRRMSMALQQEHAIEREAFMTAAEFEQILAGKGVPHDPVHELTGLFERVRYGHWQPAPGDEEKALQSLDAILAFSRTAGRGS